MIVYCPSARKLLNMHVGGRGGREGKKGGGGNNSGAGGYNRKKARYKPRGGRAAGPYDGRRPCAQVARERELTLVRALSYPNCSQRKYYLQIKYYAEIVLSPNKILCRDSTISQ